MFSKYKNTSTYTMTPNSYKKSLKNMKNHNFLMNLPSHIILEILLKLPVLTIIQCKCVCKTWLELISAPEFIPLHYSRSNPGLIIHHTEMFKNFLKIVDLGDGSDHCDLYYDPWIKFDLTGLSDFPDADIVVDGSINGFLFLRDVNYKHETLFICNPVTREYLVLPEPKQVVRYPSVVTHGFGVSALTGEYKVVRVFQERVLHHVTGSCLGITRSECKVYTLGTRSWREVGKVGFAFNSNSTGLFLNGYLHWLVEDIEESEIMISRFDLENEVFQQIPLPFPEQKVLGSLGNLNGFLCLCDNSSLHEIDIWVMKEYGVKKSWTKEFVIKKMPELMGPSFELVHALKVFRDGTILLMWGDFFMFLYCSKSKSVRAVDLNQTRGPNSIEAIHHVSNFLPLKSLTMEDVYEL